MYYSGEIFALFFLFLLVLLPAFLGTAWIIGITRRWIAIQRTRRQLIGEKTIYAHYEPPEGLRPADIAYLYDQKINSNEILATLFDLEQRHILKLGKSLKTSGQKLDFSITLLSSPQDKSLNEFEQELVIAIHNLGHKSNWSALSGIETALWESTFEASMDRRLHGLGYFSERNWLVSNTALRVFCALLLAGLVSLMPVFTSQLVISGEPQGIEDPGFALLGRDIALFLLLVMWVLGSFVTYFFMVPIFGAYSRGSKLQRASQKLRDIWPAIEGFRQFVRTVELDRISFENTKQKELARHAVLPYAVALNLKTDWQSRFTS